MFLKDESHYNLFIFESMKNKKLNIYLSLFLVIQIVFIKCISGYPTFIEAYYSNGIYPVISIFLRILLGWIPFSFGDLLIGFLFFIFLRFLYRLIKGKFKGFVPKLMQFMAVASIIYFCFYFFWGLNYFREPLAKNLGFGQTKYTTKQLITTTKHVIEKLNALQLEITKNDSLKVENPFSQKEMYVKAISGYEILSESYPQLAYKHASVKNSMMSLFQSYNGTSGYMNPLTGEAQVNDRIPKTGYPTTTCHEMAHQLGFAAENEANFVGFLAATSNEDIYFKYAGYRMAFGYLISEMRKHDKQQASDLWKTIHKGILKDFRASNAFWKQYQNPLEPIIKKGYNSYLKANNQSKGIQSYNYVVDLLISYFEIKTTKNS